MILPALLHVHHRLNVDHPMVKSLSNDCFGKIQGYKFQVVEVVVHEKLLEQVAWTFRRTRSGLVYSVIPKMSIL